MPLHGFVKYTSFCTHDITEGLTVCSPTTYCPSLIYVFYLHRRRGRGVDQEWRLSCSLLGVRLRVRFGMKLVEWKGVNGLACTWSRTWGPAAYMMAHPSIAPPRCCCSFFSLLNPDYDILLHFELPNNSHQNHKSVQDSTLQKRKKHDRVAGLCSSIHSL